MAALVDGAAKLVAGISAIATNATSPSNEKRPFFMILLLWNNVCDGEHGTSIVSRSVFTPVFIKEE